MAVDPEAIARRLRSGNPAHVVPASKSGAVSSEGRIENGEPDSERSPKKRRRAKGSVELKRIRRDGEEIGEKRSSIRTATGDDPIRVVRFVMGIEPPEDTDGQVSVLVPFSERQSWRDRNAADWKEF